MKNTLRKASWLVLLLIAFWPQTVLSLPVTRASTPPASQPLSISPAVAELGQQIQSLVTGDDNKEIEPQDTFGTRAFGVMLAFYDLVQQEGLLFVTNFAALPQLANWYDQQTSDPNLLDRWNLIGQRLLSVLGVALLAGWLASLVTFYPLQRIRRKKPSTAVARFGTLLSWLIVSIIPVIVFVVAATALIDQNQQSKIVRYFVMTSVYGMAILAFIRLGIRFFLVPRSANLRFLPLSDKQALFIQRWLNAFSLVMVVGYFGSDIAQLVRIPKEAILAFNSLVGLVVVIMAIAVVIQKRAFVSIFIRGGLSAAQHGLSPWQSLRLWLARTWHILAIAYLVVGYVVTMLQAGSGFAIMQRGTILTLLSLVAVRMALYSVSKLGRHRHHDDGIVHGMFMPVSRWFLQIAIWALGISGIAAAWGVDVEALYVSPWGQRILGSVFTITATVVIVTFVYDHLQTIIERKLHVKDSEGHEIEVNARARTLLPMIRNAAMIILALTVGLITLSELGVNIGPLLAGAGIIGVAIGFGSQALVKDFLTGLFIILEDTISVGDVVSIGDDSGVVESITIRTVRLRDLDGAMHVIPFGEITKFINRTKGYAYALIDMSVAYNSDLRHVIDVLRDEGDKMRTESEWKDVILAPIEMLGVEKFGDSSITIRCRMMTKAGKQWDTRRNYNLRIKERFDKEGIEIPFPIVTYVQKPGTDEGKAGFIPPKS